MTTANEVRLELSEHSPSRYFVRFVYNLNEESKLSLLGESAPLTPEDIDERIRLSDEFTYIWSYGAGLPSTSYLEVENASLRQEIEHVKDMLSRVIDRIPQERVIVLREMSREEAKQEVKRLFSSGKTLYYSDVAQELRFDLELVIDICNELQEEGEIAIDAGVS